MRPLAFSVVLVRPYSNLFAGHRICHLQGARDPSGGVAERAKVASKQPAAGYFPVPEPLDRSEYHGGADTLPGLVQAGFSVGTPLGGGRRQKKGYC